jgi:hypothetical protein
MIAKTIATTTATTTMTTRPAQLSIARRARAALKR